MSAFTPSSSGKCPAFGLGLSLDSAVEALLLPCSGPVVLVLCTAMHALRSHALPISSCRLVGVGCLWVQLLDLVLVVFVAQSYALHGRALHSHCCPVSLCLLLVRANV